MQNAIPVGENLKNRTILASAKCIHCDAEEESVTHLFFTCDFARRVWESFPCTSSLNLNRISDFRTGFEASKLLTCLPPIGLGEGSLSPWIFWSMWTNRNNKIFNDKHSQPMDVLSQAISHAKEWFLAQERKPPNRPIGLTEMQNLTDPRFITCTTDAAWKGDRTAGFGWIFTDHQGLEIDRGSGSAEHINSPLIAEAVAVLLALQHARNLGFTYLSLASDLSQLVKALQSELQAKELHGIQFDILDLCLSFSAISFRYLPRSQNTLADSLAKEALFSFVMGLAQH